MRTAYATRAMLLCRFEEAKRHLNEGKIFAHCPEFPTLNTFNVLVFWPWPRWLLCVLCAIVGLCICLNYGKPNWPWPRLAILTMTSVCWPWPRLVILDDIASIMCTCVCVCVCVCCV